MKILWKQQTKTLTVLKCLELSWTLNTRKSQDPGSDIAIACMDRCLLMLTLVNFSHKGYEEKRSFIIDTYFDVSEII